MKLRYKLNLLVIGLTVLSIAIPSIISFLFSKEMLKDQLDNYLQAEMSKYINEINGWMDIQSQTVVTINDIIRNAYTREDITDKLLKSYITHDSISDIYIGFYDGSFLSGQGWIPDEGYDPRIRPWYIETMKAGALNISNIYYDLTSKQNAISIGIPIQDKNGFIIGVLGEDILLHTLKMKIDAIHLKDFGYAFLVDSSGKILVHPDETLLDKNMTDLITTDMKAGFLKNQSGMGKYIYKGISKIVVYDQIKNTDWRLALVVEEKKAYAPLNNLLMVYTLIVVITILFAAILTRIVNGNIIKRLKMLSDASISFSNGKFDTEIEDLGGDEIGDVSKAFGRMKSEIKGTITELDWIAHNDMLTRLPNRLKLMEDMNEKIRNAEINKEQFAILFLDLDDFKNINDTLGYSLGDQLLQEVAKLLQEQYKTYRIGADEFVVILDQYPSTEELRDNVQRVSDILNCSFNLNLNIVYNSATIGVSIYPNDFTNLHEMMIRTDAALNIAKKNKKSSIQFYEYNISKELERRVVLEKDLRKALEDQEFLLYYQPIMDHTAKNINGFEALIRWKNKEGKLISPGEFMAVAENMSLIHDLGLWIIREALLTLRGFQEQYKQEFSMAINISANQMKFPEFIDNVIQIIHEVGVKPSCIELEITETVLIESMELAKKQLQILSDYGIRISLDDFGTGYSSLNYLQHFPIHILKIDKSFIDYLKQDTASRSLVKHIIMIAHWLDIDIVAEGVENNFQKDYLQENNCNFYQGYLFFKPMPVQEICEHLNLCWRQD